MSGMGTPLSFDQDQVDLKQENRTVEPLNDEASHVAPTFEEAGASQKVEEAPKRPIDPRAQRLAEIAENRNAYRNEELATEDERFGRQREAPPQPAPSENDFVDLKVRRQTQRMTIKERDNLLSEDWDDEDIRAMSEDEKNRSARQILARQAYDKDLESRKELIKQLQQPSQQPIHQQADPVAQEPPKTPRQLAQEKLDKAYEDLEFGVEGARARAVEAQNELADIAANEAIERSRIANIATGYDNDATSGWSEAVSDPIYQQNVLAVGMLEKAVDIGMRKTIADCLGSQPQNVQEAFLRNGITPDFIGKSSPQEIASLYKDMALKGYPVHRPSALIRAVSQHVSSQFAGPPQPAA